MWRGQGRTTALGNHGVEMNAFLCGQWLFFLTYGGGQVTRTDLALTFLVLLLPPAEEGKEHEGLHCVHRVQECNLYNFH